MELKHDSVLLPETIAALAVKPDGIYVDGTTGGGGHSLAIAEQLQTGRLICIDRDDFAHQKARERLAAHLEKVTFVKDNFANLDLILSRLGVQAIDGMVLDLGVSSFQLDDGSRGFSYHTEAPLDMRMDKEDVRTAQEVVNTYAERELSRILFSYGEEKFAPRIAAAIVRARQARPIETTTELAEIIKDAIPAAARREGGHPAKRSFQAIRIEVNGELDILRRTVFSAARHLNKDGRLAVITFHSLEDRIIKKAFADLCEGCICPKDFPVCVCGRKPLAEAVTKKPVTAGKEELERNNRSRSAKLRVIRRTKEVWREDESTAE